jgi:hypothetical protein
MHKTLRYHGRISRVASPQGQDALLSWLCEHFKGALSSPEFGRARKFQDALGGTLHGVPSEASDRAGGAPCLCSERLRRSGAKRSPTGALSRVTERRSLRGPSVCADRAAPLTGWPDRGGNHRRNP